MMNALRKRTVAEDLSQRTALVSQVKSLKMKIKRVEEILYAAENSPNGKAIHYYMTQMNDHITELEQVEFKLEELDHVEYSPLPEDVLMEVARDFKTVFEESNLVLRKSFLHSLIEKIVIKDHDAKLVYHPPAQAEGLCPEANFRFICLLTQAVLCSVFLLRCGMRLPPLIRDPRHPLRTKINFALQYQSQS